MIHLRSLARRPLTFDYTYSFVDKIDFGLRYR